MLMVVIDKSLLIFSEVTFKMAAWWPYWIFWFPDSNFSLALNINSKLKWHNTYVYGYAPVIRLKMAISGRHAHIHTGKTDISR